jgi:hypothetical protein
MTKQQSQKMRGFFGHNMLLTALSRATHDRPEGRRSPRTRAKVPFCYYPCPCGWYGDPVKECTCSNSMVSRYQPVPQAPAASLRRAQGKFRPAAGPGRPSVGRHSHGRTPGRGRLCESDEKPSDERMGEPSFLFLANRNRRHPGAGGRRSEGSDARERQRQRFEGTGLMSNADRRTCAGPSARRQAARVLQSGRGPCPNLARVRASLLRAAMKQLHGKRLLGPFPWKNPIAGFFT